MKRLLLPLGLLLLFAAEIFRVYFIMPFPGSQHNNTIQLAYFLNHYIMPIRVIALIMVIAGVWPVFRYWSYWKKSFFILGMALYALIFYMVNFKFLADKMFYQPKNKIMVAATANKVGMDKLVLGVTINNESRAYPIELIGYHHQVQDTIGGEPVMITYCTVCRTGRAYSPLLNGKKETFRLVGMDHFNAMFEDKTTKSWWRQVTGEAIAGKMKGTSLKELPSEQMRLGAWLERNPKSLVMQPDPAYLKKYKGLEGFDIGTIQSGLERRDSSSWNNKSWVVGVSINGTAKAYDWNQLIKERVINDSLPGLPIVIMIEDDNASFHVYTRNVRIGEFNNITAITHFHAEAGGMRDDATHSLWNASGLCTEGLAAGQQLKKVQSSQEFWHSWKTFHPNTTIYK